MIKAITTHDSEDAKKIWEFIKKEVGESKIKSIEIERDVLEITDGLNIIENAYSGKFQVRLICIK